MRRRSLLPTEQELEIMKILWARGEATVRDVYEELRQHRTVAYTTVMTMLGVLEGKQHVQKLAGEDRAFIYRPVLPRDEVVANMTNEFVGRVFNGSGRALVEQMLQNGSISREELNEISRLPLN
ncbi:MAG TPA: BlaI/MecI/CopY family transcriptional regulator [Bryobacteraceae bacterium]|nr:BlaI/MecI/CopY family transcriptional regulator [Bryobacteraceae bacterium]